MTPLDAFAAWLPVPEFRFIGGPVDGKTLVVRLIRTERGMIAPEVWQLAVEPKVDFSNLVEAEVEVPIHTYRFVSHGRANVGHYEWIAQ